jgi:hypothetical protein
LFSLVLCGREAANIIATFPVAVVSRQRIAQASLEKAPKIDGCFSEGQFSVISFGNAGIIRCTERLSSLAEPTSGMDKASFYAAVLVLLFSMYALKVCVRNFRGSSQKRYFKAYLYGAGAAFSCGLIVLALFRVFLSLFGPFH